MDEALLNEEEMKDEMGGSTAVCCLIKDKKLYCANAGDSRAIACVNGQVNKIAELGEPIFDIRMNSVRPSPSRWIISRCFPMKSKGFMTAVAGWRTAGSMAAWPCPEH